jgi:hypothetical protein
MRKSTLFTASTALAVVLAMAMPGASFAFGRGGGGGGGGHIGGGGDASYCAQRYRSYDPASGTYLGFDGLRHPCP